MPEDVLDEAAEETTQEEGPLEDASDDAAEETDDEGSEEDLESDESLEEDGEEDSDEEEDEAEAASRAKFDAFVRKKWGNGPDRWEKAEKAYWHQANSMSRFDKRQKAVEDKLEYISKKLEAPPKQKTAEEILSENPDLQEYQQQLTDYEADLQETSQEAQSLSAEAVKQKEKIDRLKGQIDRAGDDPEAYQLKLELNARESEYNNIWNRYKDAQKRQTRITRDKANHLKRYEAAWKKVIESDAQKQDARKSEDRELQEISDLIDLRMTANLAEIGLDMEDSEGDGAYLANIVRTQMAAYFNAHQNEDHDVAALTDRFFEDHLKRFNKERANQFTARSKAKKQVSRQKLSKRPSNGSPPPRARRAKQPIGPREAALQAERDVEAAHARMIRQLG